MTLHMFVLRQKELLGKFDAHWNEQRKAEPESYPLEMDEEEWNEQFEAFMVLESDIEENVGG